MKKLLGTVAACAFALSAASLHADDHEQAPSVLAYGQAYILNASDPAGVVSAITNYRNSADGAKSPASVSLSQVVGGGIPGTTHTILVSFPSGAAMDEGNRLNADSPMFAETSRALQEASERHSVVMFSLLRNSAKEGAVTSQNPVSWLYSLTVTDQQAFQAAFDKLWTSVAADFPGNVVFGAVLADGPSSATHFISFQANDMATLLSGMEAVNTSDAAIEYFASASSFRSVASETISRTVMNWPAAGNN
jgi:hypothetical protein